MNISVLRARHRLPTALVALAFVFAFSFGALVGLARANHYHVNCVGHGFVHGDSTTDGSFFSRVESGCGGSTRYCAIYSWWNFVGAQYVSGSTTCNAWSFAFGSYTECASFARVSYAGVFSEHDHLAHNWCA